MDSGTKRGLTGCVQNVLTTYGRRDFPHLSLTPVFLLGVGTGTASYRLSQTHVDLRALSLRLQKVRLLVLLKVR
jgi:hypothetical protein